MRVMQKQSFKYTFELRKEAVHQVIDRDHSVVDVVKQLGIRAGLLYIWPKMFKAANEPVGIDGMKSIQPEFNLTGCAG